MCGCVVSCVVCRHTFYIVAFLYNVENLNDEILLDFVFLTLSLHRLLFSHKCCTVLRKAGMLILLWCTCGGWC